MCLQICVCVDCALRAVVSHRTLHVTFRTWNHVKSKCLNIFRATIHGRDVMDWTKDSGSDLQAGRPQAGAHVSTKECGNMKPCYQRMPFNRKMADGKFCCALFLCTQALFSISLIFSFWVQKEEKFVLLQKQQYIRSALSQHSLSITCNVSSTLL